MTGARPRALTPSSVVVLAAVTLMVATPLAGVAQAGIASVDRHVSETELDPGGTAEVTTTVMMDGDGGNLSISESFTPQFGSVDNLTVTVNGDAVDPFIAVSETSGIVVAFGDELGANAVVNVTYTVTVAGPAATVTSYSISGTVAGEGGEQPIGESTLDVPGAETTTPSPTTTAGVTPATEGTQTSESTPADAGGDDGGVDADGGAGNAGDSDGGADGGDGGGAESTASGSGPVLSASGVALLAGLVLLGYRTVR